VKLNIKNADKAEVLCALYEASRPLGMGILHYVKGPLDKDEARTLLSESTSFDYLKGRVMKVHLDKDVFDTRLYDRDNGSEAAFNALANVRGVEIESI